MGASHTVQAPANWEIPTRSQLSRGHAIREQVANTHHDTPGAWARMINNLYEYVKPPLIVGVPIDPVTATGADSWTTFARYKIPLDHTGTASDEGVVFSGYAAIANGDTGFLRVTTPAAPAPSGISFTSAAAAWRENLTSKVSVDTDLGGPGGDPEVTFEGKATTSGSNLTVDAWHIDWWGGDSTLPNGPFDNAFLPMEPAALTAQETALSVEEMQRMHRNLLDLYRRRTAGMICSQWWANSKTVNGKQVRQWVMQPPFADQVRVWAYVHTGGGTWSANLGSATSSTLATPLAASWRSIDFAINRVLEPTPVRFGLTVDNAAVQGVCAWFRPILGRLR